MCKRIKLHTKARCQHNGSAGMAPLLRDFFTCLANHQPAVVFPSDWPSQKRVLPDTSGLADDIFYIGFTSGSTGTPKAFYRTQQSWLASFRALGMAPNKIVTTGDLSHSLHLFAGVYACHHGCQFSSFDHFSVPLLNQALSDCDWMFTTPAQLRALCRGARRYPNVSTVWVSGAALQPSDIEQASQYFPNGQIRQFYGASETSFIAISDSHTPPGSVGRPADIGVQIRLDDQRRIWLNSAMIFSGYLLPEHLPAQSWITVDDVGYVDDKGYLYVQGRLQRMINSAGLNIYPEEVEQALRQFPMVDDAAAVGLPCQMRGEKLAAVIASQGDIDHAALMAHLRTTLGRHRAPKRLLQVPQLPHNRAGKVDLGAIVELLSHRC